MVEGSTPYPSPSELCAKGLLMLEEVVVVVGGLLHIHLYIHLNCVQGVGVVEGRSTPYLSLYPSKLCSQTNTQV